MKTNESLKSNITKSKSLNYHKKRASVQQKEIADVSKTYGLTNMTHKHKPSYSICKNMKLKPKSDKLTFSFDIRELRKNRTQERALLYHKKKKIDGKNCLIKIYSQ